jgi:DNA-binding response OmpR family regulator
VSAVLIAEPQSDVRGFLERHLAQDGFDVVGTHDGDAALELALRAHPDLVLLGDATAVESFRGVPVIVIGGDDSDAIDRVRAFARGCDDFVARPFVYDELVARINAVLRRARPAQRDCVEAGRIWIEHSTRRVNVGGVRVDLAAKEYELLLKLASDPQRVFTKEELLREVWGFRSLGRTRTLDSHASRLRRKLQAVDPGPFVINVWRVGSFGSVAHGYEAFVPASCPNVASNHSLRAGPCGIPARSTSVCIQECRPTLEAPCAPESNRPSRGYTTGP